MHILASFSSPAFLYSLASFSYLLASSFHFSTVGCFFTSFQAARIYACLEFKMHILASFSSPALLYSLASFSYLLASSFHFSTVGCFFTSFQAARIYACLEFKMHILASFSSPAFLYSSASFSYLSASSFHFSAACCSFTSLQATRIYACLESKMHILAFFSSPAFLYSSANSLLILATLFQLSIVSAFSTSFNAILAYASLDITMHTLASSSLPSSSKASAVSS